MVGGSLEPRCTDADIAKVLLKCGIGTSAECTVCHSSQTDAAEGCLKSNYTLCYNKLKPAINSQAVACKIAEARSGFHLHQADLRGQDSVHTCLWLF